jgi:hypothetical protein
MYVYGYMDMEGSLYKNRRALLVLSIARGTRYLNLLVQEAYVAPRLVQNGSRIRL